MSTIVKEITDCIERYLDIKGDSSGLIIYPCGDVGIQSINVLETVYCIEPAYIIDNNKCRFSERIHDISLLDSLDVSKYYVFLTSTNHRIYKELKENVQEFFKRERVIELASMGGR